MKAICIALFALISIHVFAQQKPMLTDENQIKSQAIKELGNSSTNPEDEFYRFITENQITGQFTFDLTIREKGVVATVFAVNSNVTDVKKQNLLKDKLLTYKFNFRMPKGKLYKFQYTFNF